MKRIRFLDTIRGFALFNMIIYHTIWNLVCIFNVEISWFGSIGAHIWQQLICSAFILLSGFCFNLGKKNLKRSIFIIICSFIITAVTYFFINENVIYFGILSLIGSSMLFLTFFEKIFKKINPHSGLIIFFILFILTKNIENGFIGIKSLLSFTVPDILYKNYFTSYLGFPHSGFSSSDYFPIFPWIFLYISGYFLFKTIKNINILYNAEKFSIKPLEWAGKNSIYIYMLHQPVIYAILYMIFIFLLD